jgi:sigma-B regulation protein RsbU (phosphoserine phosphatase)
MTLTLLRYHDDGRVELAGAHQEIILRGADGTVRTVETSGPWVAAVPDVDVEDGRLELARGETMVLFTDGVVEARTASDGIYGIDRLVESVVESPSPEAEVVRDAVFAQLASVAPTRDDDATVLVVRRLGEAGRGA